MPKGSIDRLRPVAAAALLSLLCSCAGQVAPPGGPVDSVPPRIIRTVPDSNAVGVRPERVLLEFSEYVDRRSLEESVFLSPDVGVLEFDWSGREVEIVFAEPLRDSVTYVLSVGTDVVDIRAGNRMESGFSLAFSTGPRIDNAAIAGRIVDDSPEGVFVYAYRIDRIEADTLDPTRARPDYVTQAGSGGRFLLSHLAEGRYRLIAVRDQYKNLRYDIQVDAYGVGRRDYAASESSGPTGGVWFRLAREDTTLPFLSSVASPGGRQIRLRFSEPLDSLSVDAVSVEVRDTTTDAAVSVLTVFPAGQGWTELGALLGADLSDGRPYRVTVRGCADTAGNPLDTDNASLTLLGTAEPDTTRPTVLLAGLADSLRGVATETTVLLMLSEPVDTARFLAGLALGDIARGDLELDHRWRHATRLELRPQPTLREATWYGLRLDLAAVVDPAGNAAADSVFSLAFETLDPRETGEIIGSVFDPVGEGLRGPLHLTAVPLAGRGREASMVLRTPGRFSLREVREGRYRLLVFEDADSSGAYSYGLPYPFVPSERFAVHADTLRVRARWTVENAELVLGR